MRRITLITTGGTIEKTYDDRTGALANRQTIVGRMLRRLRLVDTRINTIELMSKDSREMTDGDRGRILEALRAMGADGEGEPATEGVLILHGTDTLSHTGEYLHKALERPSVPIILTGAIRPYEMKQSDAFQNLTESLFATGVLAPGVYCVAHGRAMRFPGVYKDVETGTFVGGQSARTAG